MPRALARPTLAMFSSWNPLAVLTGIVRPFTETSVKHDFAIYYDILIQLCGERPADSVVGMDRIECPHNQSCASRDSSGRGRKLNCD